MSVVVKLTENGKDKTLAALAPLLITEELSTELNSGTLRYLRTESDSKGVIASLAPYSIAIDDEKMDFVGVDSRALFRRGSGGKSIYNHDVALTETSKLLEGALIDGFGVSQPENVEERQTLLEVYTRLMDVYSLDEQEFNGVLNAETQAVFDDTICPEFRFSAQTTLWECLVRLGAVVDAVPRLTHVLNYDVIEFVFVNACTNEVDSIDGELVNAIGENLDEGQYNDALSSVVENVRES